MSLDGLSAGNATRNVTNYAEHVLAARNDARFVPAFSLVQVELVLDELGLAGFCCAIKTVEQSGRQLGRQDVAHITAE